MSKLDSDQEFKKIINKVETTLSSNVGISQKLEFTLPIIPLLLNYKIETGIESEADMQKLKAKIRQGWNELLLKARTK